MNQGSQQGSQNHQGQCYDDWGYQVECAKHHREVRLAMTTMGLPRAVIRAAKGTTAYVMTVSYPVECTIGQNNQSDQGACHDDWGYQVESGRRNRADNMDRAGRAAKEFATMIGATKSSAVRAAEWTIWTGGQSAKEFATMIGATKSSAVRCNRADRVDKIAKEFAMTTGATK